MTLLDHYNDLQTYSDFQPTGFDAKGLHSDDIGPARILLSVNRDSDCLEQSNFYCALTVLGGESEHVQIHRFGHWGCGWFDLLLIMETATDETKEIAGGIACSLADYPVLDDDDHSAREQGEADALWGMYSTADRIDYIRRNRSQFNLHSYQDLIANCRGRYFSGYASELIR